MDAEIRILSGATAGRVIRLSGSAVVGRSADAGVRLDPDLDLQVSARHAVLDVDANSWLIRDTGSRNGTFVNGRRVVETRLTDGDRIRFGEDGPEAEFRLAGVEPPASSLARQNTRLRLVAGLLGLALTTSVLGTFWLVNRGRSDWERERAGLLARIDSTLASGDSAVRALAGEREELAAAYQQSRAEVRRVRQALENAGSDPADVEDLRRRLQTAMEAVTRQQLAASIDHAAIERATRRSVAVVYVETGDGATWTGTAFAVRSDATLVTARHILESGDGAVSPRQIGVQFSDSDQVWPARIVRYATDADIAVIKVDNIVGGVTAAPPFNERVDTLGPGTPVAWIGFPLGGTTAPQDSRTGRLARPLVSVGVITAVTPRSIEVQGYGAEGASGSPILDSAGRIVAVLYGGRREDGTQLLVAVPANAVVQLVAGGS
ncbi:MAG: trypsin-like peptidase domain-containing protein [Gemmatimonadota bacterium]